MGEDEGSSLEGIGINHDETVCACFLQIYVNQSSTDEGDKNITMLDFSDIKREGEGVCTAKLREHIKWASECVLQVFSFPSSTYRKRSFTHPLDSGHCGEINQHF